jgi:DNA-binding NarL/FixJ family response regulator
MSIVREAKVAPRAPRTVILSAYGDIEYVLVFLKAGASAYLLKGEDPALLAQAVRAVARGETWLSPGVSAALLRHTVIEPMGSPLDPLSPRELEILRLIARGLDNPAIATHLGVSEGTVKNHVTHLYDKLSVRSRAEAVVWAWEHRLVTSSLPPQT